MSETQASNTASAAAPYAIPVDGAAVAEAIRRLGVTHVVCVPDTNLKSVISALGQPGMPRLIYTCTEDEAMGVNAGLYITGHKPMLLIQNNGLLACLNTLKAIALDAAIPTFMLIGEYGRDVMKPLDKQVRAVALLEPTLATWSVPSYRLDEAAGISNLQTAWDLAWSSKGPTTVLVGAPTC